MTRSRLAVAHVFSLALAASLAGCLVHERDAGDAGNGDAFIGFGDVALPDGGLVLDVGTLPDVGWCECPAPPPGCVYDGTPCGCSHMTCTPQLCGRELCGPGTECCNSSCSLCVGPGMGCIDLACAPDCAPQDAHSNGRCAGEVGWAWDGTACRAIACRCAGTECDRVYPSFEACNAYFSACPIANCNEEDATGVGGCAAVLGYAFTVRGCLPVSGCSCAGADCAAVAGRSEAECNTLHEGCPILFL